MIVRVKQEGSYAELAFKFDDKDKMFEFLSLAVDTSLDNLEIAFKKEDTNGDTVRDNR